MSMSGALLNGVGLWITRRERQQERDDSAVRSVLTAVNRTKGYIAARGRGEPSDREAEAQLVDLWTEASVQIRRTDPDLARRLLRKADYWTNPENWTNAEIADNRIQIDKIAEEAEKILGTV